MAKDHIDEIFTFPADLLFPEQDNEKKPAEPQKVPACYCGNHNNLQYTFSFYYGVRRETVYVDNGLLLDADCHVNTRFR